MSIWKAEPKDEGEEARYIISIENPTNKKAQENIKEKYNSAHDIDLDSFAKSLNCVAIISTGLAYKLEGTYLKKDLKNQVSILKIEAKNAKEMANELSDKLANLP